MEGRCRAAICNCASWHGKCPLAVISGTILDGEKPLSELHVRMSAASVVTRGAGMVGLCVYNVGLQLCKWKVGSSGHGTVKAQSSWRHLRDGLLDNTSESKPRDPSRPHCVMEAQPASFHTPPISQRQRPISSGLLPVCGLQGDLRSQAHGASVGKIPQHPGSSNPSQHRSQVA